MKYKLKIITLNLRIVKYKFKIITLNLRIVGLWIEVHYKVLKTVL